MKRNATITVDAGRKSEHTINPYVFGHFVEDIRDHMEAMLAYPLKDMDFESEASSPEPRAVSGRWTPYTNGRGTVYAMEPPAPKHSGRAQRVRMMSDDEAYAGISQKVALKGPSEYAVKLVARASVEIRYLVVEAADRRTGDVIGVARIELAGHDWKSYEATLAVARECVDAELRVYVPAEHPRWIDHVSTGMFWLDHVSLLPADSIGMVRKEVMDMTRPLNAGMMRLAGNYISAYHWEYGVGPVLERPILYNEAWGGWANKYFGTDEFIAFCQELGVEPLICVNDGSGTPEEAARWIEYCNGGPDTPMGAKRAANGHPEPYRVRYWEIGNEVWGQWQVGTCTAEEFAERCAAFAKAMKAADPEIVLLACGHTDQEWNKPLLERAGGAIDYLTLHLYHGFNRFGMNRETPAEERYRAIVSFPEWTRSDLARTEETIQAYPQSRHVKVAITEYNTMFYPNTIRKGLPDEHTLGAAVANAGNLNEMLRRSDLVRIGSFSDLVNGWLGGCIRVGDFYADQFRGKEAGWSGRPLTVYGTPTYEVMKLYAGRDIRRMLPAQAECGTFSVASAKPAPADLNALPDLDVAACANEDGSLVTVFVVNRSLEKVTAKLDLKAFEAGEDVRVHEIAGDSIEAINSVFEPERIVCTERIVPASAWREGVALRPASVYALEIRASRN
ncbi:alpha-L-arabinofuranosidase C-terminal domain-containing protein [Cohnella zeiphila]|uniref:non-reducing end alpha-L-arabinofuranosidase n=1 Tax=Cohnella zeiphila TaxID=2761120 RepID=A0A7X0VVP6_9BACL|nr:alpha-L-arabinofuranosidase C-terminal domain-containing protein [Cohnella zeiphila]MBB6731572.1 alpha-L-arabinofuranosidase [Cohnella zeiphila]